MDPFVLVNLYITRALTISIPTIIIAFINKNAYCAGLAKIYGIFDMGLSEWLLWIATMELISSYLVILMVLTRENSVLIILSGFFDVLTFIVKVGMIVGGIIIMAVSVETCFSEAFLLLSAGLINLACLFGDIITRLYVYNGSRP